MKTFFHFSTWTGRKPFLLLLASAWALFSSPAGAQFGGNAQPPVAASLVAEETSVQSGRPFWVALRMKMEEHWHVYWSNPGDIGLPTTIAWDLPEGFKAGEIVWPVPHPIPSAIGTSYGYDKELYLPIQITPPANLPPGSSVTLKGKAEWLACKENCIPGDAEVKLTLPVSDSPEKDASFADAVAGSRKQAPVSMPDWKASLKRDGKKVLLRIDLPQAPADWKLDELYFFPAASGLINASSKQHFSLDGKTLVGRFDAPEAPDASLADGSGVLYLKSASPSAVALSLPLAATPAPATPSGGADVKAVDPFDSETPSPSVPKNEDKDAATRDYIYKLSANGVVSLQGEQKQPLHLSLALLLGYLGGILLNLMPCVFPVLSLKIMGFIQQAGEDKARIRKHGVIFTSGVLVSMWVLVGVLITLRLAGENLGWGFQLQSPGFLAFLIMLLFFFGLNLSGLFEIGASLISVGAEQQHKEGLSGSFFSGVLAVLVATPCTGPFMGGAIGYALSQSIFFSILIFTALALGIATPYLLLSFFPAAIQKLPRPGAWMITFKQIMAFLLYATVVWLMWVFGKVTGLDGMFWMLITLLLLAFLAWFYGRFASPLVKPLTRHISLGVTGLLAVVVFFTAQESTQYKNTPPLVAKGQTTEKYGLQWEAFSPQRLYELQEQGKIVYIDFTAAWCLTCQTNKKAVFQSPTSDSVIQKFQEHGVVPMIADWTNHNWVIKETLEAFGRQGVPYNLVFTGNLKKAPIELPATLLPDTVITALDKAAQK